MPATTTRYATYKGRTYRLLYLGDTKFGKRAKLGFSDGSKTFWADAGAIRETDSPPASHRAARHRKEDDECEACGGNKWTCGHCVGW